MIPPARQPSPARQVVVRLIQETLSSSGRAQTDLVDEQGLFADGVGLDSLDFATLVVRLERETGRDPFRSSSTARLPRTVGDLVALYEPRPQDEPATN